MNTLHKFLLWVGVVKIGRKSSLCNYVDGVMVYRYPEQIIWPIHVSPLWMWKHPIATARCSGWFYVFRNLRGIRKRIEGRLLPARWGFGVMGLIEFGDRG